MDFPFSLSPANLAQLRQVQNSAEYQDFCKHFGSEISRLEAQAQQLLPRIPQLESELLAGDLRTEYAAGSNLHRGFYCPSYVYDLFTGGAKRGRIMKKLSAKSKPSHRYLFHPDGRLLQSAICGNGPSDIAAAEYLFYHDDTVTGIGISGSGKLQTISEERYDGKRLLHYLSCLVNGSSIGDLQAEYYRYEGDTLVGCELHHFMSAHGLPDEYKLLLPPEFLQPLHRVDRYTFLREEGRIVGYTRNGHTFPITPSKKA